MSSLCDQASSVFRVSWFLLVLCGLDFFSEVLNGYCCPVLSFLYMLKFVASLGYLGSRLYCVDWIFFYSEVSNGCCCPLLCLYPQVINVFRSSFFRLSFICLFSCSNHFISIFFLGSLKCLCSFLSQHRVKNSHSSFSTFPRSASLFSFLHKQLLTNFIF